MTFADVFSFVLQILAYFGGFILLLCFPFATYLFMLAIAALFYRDGSTSEGFFWKNRGIANLSAPPLMCFVIPAHNEEQTINETISSCFRVNYPREKYEVLVIADNCSDSTADMARACGAKVVERFSDTRKSKGYALEDVFAQILAGEHTAADAFIVIDADTSVDQNVLKAFAAATEAGADWLQGWDGVENVTESWRTALMNYSFSLFNGVWLKGQHVLGLGSALRGNGMCFTRRGLLRVPWCSAGLAEDLEFSWHLRLVGERVHYLDSAKVYASMLADSSAGAQTQRQRWEAGRAALRSVFTKKIWQVPQSSLLKKLLLTIDLQSRGLSSLFLGVLAGTLFSSLLFIPFPLFGAGLVTIGLLELFAVSFYLLCPFLVMAVGWHEAKSLAHAPIYILWRIVVLLKPKPSGWVRTARTTEKKPQN